MKIIFFHKSDFFHEIQTCKTLACSKSDTKASRMCHSRANYAACSSMCLLGPLHQGHLPSGGGGGSLLSLAEGQGWQAGEQKHKKQRCQDSASNGKARVLLFDVFLFSLW